LIIMGIISVIFGGYYGAKKYKVYQAVRQKRGEEEERLKMRAEDLRSQAMYDADQTEKERIRLQKLKEDLELSIEYERVALVKGYEAQEKFLVLEVESLDAELLRLAALQKEVKGLNAEMELDVQNAMADVKKQIITALEKQIKVSGTLIDLFMQNLDEEEEDKISEQRVIYNKKIMRLTDRITKINTELFRVSDPIPFIPSAAANANKQRSDLKKELEEKTQALKKVREKYKREQDALIIQLAEARRYRETVMEDTKKIWKVP